MTENSYVPRAFFVQGLPQDETTRDVTGRQLHELIRKFIVVAHSSGSPRIQYTLRFDRNVHRKIRDGSFLLLFDDAETAQQIWNFLAASSPDEKQSGEFINIKIPLDALLAASPENQPSTSCSLTYFTLSISWSAGQLRDHFFPLIPYSIRRNILMDPTATYSLTDMLSANRMAKLLCEAILPASSPSSVNERNEISICDAFACVGGNTFGFLQLGEADVKNEEKSGPGGNKKVVVSSIELDKERCAMLQKNYEMMKGVDGLFGKGNDELKIHNGCTLEFLATTMKLVATATKREKCFDILFFDPPWGGPTEMKQEKSAQKAIESEKNNEEEKSKSPGFPPFSVSKSTFDALLDQHSNFNHERNAASSSSSDEVRSVNFEDLVASLVISKSNRNIASIIALKLPAEKWCEQEWVQNLVNKCVGLTSTKEKKMNDCDDDDEESRNNDVNASRERVFPLLFNFGASVRLLCLVQNSIENPISGIVSNKTLDEMVSRLWKFNVVEGFREMKPRYFDFEKKRWIELKKWLGSKEE